MYRVNLNGASAQNGEKLRGEVKFPTLGAAVDLAAATGGEVILPKGTYGIMAEKLWEAMGLERVGYRTIGRKEA